MKLKHLDQYIDFIEAVQTCAADVCFCSDEGDRLNLKSTLSQFAFASAVAVKLPSLDADIRCRETDLPLLLPFLEE